MIFIDLKASFGSFGHAHYLHNASAVPVGHNRTQRWQKKSSTNLNAQFGLDAIHLSIRFIRKSSCILDAIKPMDHGG